MLVQEFAGDYPVDSIWDLDVEVDGDNEHGVKMLPARDTPTEKHALLFFLPEIPVDKEASYSVSWRWPKTMCALTEFGSDSWSTTVKSATDVKLIRVHFKLHKDIPIIKIENTGHGKGRRTSTENAKDVKGYREYSWELNDVKQGTHIELTLTVI